jgi:tetratricopeptide (TPR) repeat protein
MDRSRLDRVAELFKVARRLAPAERDAWLSAESGADDALREELVALLAEHDSDSSSLEPGQSAEEARRWFDARTADGETNELPPFRVPGFRLLSRLGEGGQGVVYEAEQARPKRTVALKLMRPGLGGSGMRRRFEREADTLARLQHPGIATVHESGVVETEFGDLPFFAMELVRGRTIVEHAKARGLPARERLELLAEVCDAVAHAHGQGVVHRDLKPSNVLVDASGRPRILDFGIARILDTDLRASTLETRTGQILGTLAYMSPEQASGRPEQVDARADVFALGVIAFELLSGALPRDLADRSLPEAMRIVAEGETSLLGAVDSALRGDVETVVAAAMASEKDRRYPDADAFGADLRRCARNEPVTARRATTLYHLGRFVRRHRALSASLGALVLALAAGLVGTGVGLVRAERELERANEITDFLKGMLSSLRPESLPEASVRALRLVVDRARADLERGEFSDPVTEAELCVVLSSTYLALGDHAASGELAERGRRMLLEELGGGHPKVLEADAALAALAFSEKRIPDAIAAFEALLEALPRTHGENHELVAQAAVQLGNCYANVGRFEDAAREIQRALDLYASRYPADHPNVLSTRLVLLYNEIFWASSERDAERVQAGSERLAELRDETVEALGSGHRESLNVTNQLANTYRIQGRVRESAALLEEALPEVVRALGDEHPDTIRMIVQLGYAHNELGRAEESLDRLEQALEVVRDAYPPGNIDLTYLYRTLTQAYEQLGPGDERADGAHRGGPAPLDLPDRGGP